MGALSFFGHLLLGFGPIIIVFLFCIARKSLLVLLCLASAFYWLVTLFVISCLFRGFEPLSASVGPYLGLTIVAVLAQEAARLGVVKFHGLSVNVLEKIARDETGGSLTISDRFSLSLTHGFGHGAVHSLFFFVCWLPLSLGDGTIYLDTCPHMSYYLVGALSTLGFAALHTGSMVVAVDGLERRDLKQGLMPAGAHLAAALLTLVNFTPNGCLATVPLLLVGGGAMATYASRIWWQRTAVGVRPSRPEIQ